MNLRGPCSSCGAQLAVDQRYCVDCGQRVGPPMALPYIVPGQVGAPPATAGLLGFALPIPLQTVSTFAALALGFGVVVGTAISPNLAGIVAAPSPTVVAQAPPTETPSSPATGGTGGGGGGGGISSGSGTTFTSDTSTGSGSGTGGGNGGGGGGKKKKKKKQKQQPQTFTGTVVRVNNVAQSYTLAAGGALISIHSAAPPKVGDTVQSPVRRLKNGTYTEQGARKAQGTATDANFLGTVTYCADLQQPAASCDGSVGADKYVYAVSSLGASVLVTAPSTPTPPRVGTQVQVGVHIGAPFAPVPPTVTTDFTAYPPPCTPSGDEGAGAPAQDPTVPELIQTSIAPAAQQTNALLEAVVQQTNCTDGLVLSADDNREAGRDLRFLTVPTGIDQTKLTRGQAVQVAVDIDGSGNLTLKGITSDAGAAGADDPSQGQGSLAGV
jgi:hypothetical protein